MMKLLGLFLGIMALVACSSYNQVLKGDDYAAKYSTAGAYFEEGTKRSYEKAIVLYEQVFQNSPKSKEGELSYFMMAKSYFEKEDFYMAAYFFGSYIQRYPYSYRNEEALFLTAMCNVNNSPKWSLDQTETYEALNSVQQFIDKYPNSPLIDSCNRLIDQLSFKLEVKDYNKIILYDKTLNFKAAVAYTDLFLEKFPLTEYEEEVRYLSIKNSFILSENSIETKKKERIEETLRRYRNFTDDFPNSKYLTIIKSLLKPWENDYEF